MNRCLCAVLGAALLTLGYGSAGAQVPLPTFFDGMALLEENHCPSFTVSYYAAPAVNLAELENDRSEKGYGFVVMPKTGIRLEQVQTASTEPAIISVNFVITYEAPGKPPHDITSQAHDHAAPPESAMILSPLFGEGGVFYTGGSYRDVLGFRTNGEFGRGSVVIDDRSPQIFRGSDGSSCTIRAPKVRFQIQ